MSRIGVTAVVMVSLLLVLPVAACAPSNRLPEIVSLDSRARVIAPSDSVLVECIAHDEDGDALTYDWVADRGVINGQAGVIAWTAPGEEGLARISVTVSDGGEQPVSQSLTIIVKRNQSPVINELAADRDWVRPGETLLIGCVAEDLDADQLSYTWSAEGGTIVGQSETATWTAPEEQGEYSISVVVDDGYDGRATASLSVVCSQYEPLLVKDITVTAVDAPYYLVARTDWYKVYWEDTYIIECSLSDPERDVTYEWSVGESIARFPVGVEGITFEGGPSRIRWTAPKERGDHLMTVMARDDAGNVATKTVTLFVESCTCAFPSDSTPPNDAA